MTTEKENSKHPKKENQITVDVPHELTPHVVVQVALYVPACETLNVVPVFVGRLFHVIVPVE